MTLTHGFELIREETIHELNTVARRYRHVQSGADLLSLQNDDENKSFGIAFRTPPTDSTGLPHIMEHSVLCGSRKYPLKEPFTELLKGSLKTFLNAFTSPDRTIYPVASANLQDFYNLVDVYLDAVFFPRITPQILAQEGWHFEMEGPEDDLSFKGVVFNEMKGAYSSPDNLLYRYGRQSLFPDTVYANDSGGDPAVMPDLTYEQFKNFHDTYYHPSNAMIFFAGDDEPTERLRILDAYLSEFGALDVDASIPIQPPFDAPRHVTIGYDAGDEPDGDNKGMVVVEWAMPPEVSSPAEMLLISILSYTLVGMSGAPLQKALIDSGLGEGMTGGGFGDDLRQMTFSAGLKGIDPAKAPEVEALILSTLSQVADEGLDPESIEAAVNTLEFNLRENNTGSFPRGLAMMMRVMSEWANGQDPVDHLAFEASLEEVKSMLADQPGILQERIRRYLVENPHRATVLLQPDPTVGPARDAAEQARLDAAWAAMTPDDVMDVITETHALRLAQETPDSPEALAAIPTLTLADLPREEKPIPSVESTIQGSRVLVHDLATNGIVYLDLGFDLHTLPQDLLPYVPLFSRALLQMGTEEEDYVKLTQRIGRKTGGLWTDRMESAQLASDEAVAWLLLRGKSTVEQAPEMLGIMADVLTTVRLDNPERFRQLVLESKARKESGVIPSGHSFVNDRLRASFNEADWLSEQWSGVSSLFFLRQLAQEIETDWPGILAKLEAIRTTLLNRNAMLCNITVDGEGWDAVRPALDSFLADLPGTVVRPVHWQRASFPSHEGLTIPAQVNYVGKGVNLYELGYEYSGSMIAISNYLRNGYIWDKVRVQGGAYGGFVSFDRHSGIYAYLSYRDPNLADTLAVYDSVGAYLRGVDLPQEELTKSIIGAIGRLDAYQMPDAKGYTALVRTLLGSTVEERQRIRDQVLSTSVADFRQLGEVLSGFSAAGRVVVLGSADGIAQANAGALGNLLSVQKVL